MRGFAYPNISNRTFIGCGRYRAADGEKEEGESQAQLPKMSHPARIFAAVLSLAPELRENHTPIYERQDCPDELYQGDSMGLAYLLASIHRVRRVRQPFEALPGHIWCTGALDPHAPSPTLKDVDQNEFVDKLRAFRAVQNPDRVFLVPFANAALVEAHGYQEPLQSPEPLEPVKLLDLQDLREEVFSHKVVVKIHAHELPFLVAVLFQSPRDPEIVQWFQALMTLRKQGQITDKQYGDVLTYAVQSPLEHSAPAEVLLDLLHDQPRDVLKQRLYFKGAIGQDAISKTPLAVTASTLEAPQDTPTLYVHQVLVAIRYGLPMGKTALGLRFILMPPGKAPNGTVNPEAYYLAQTPVSKADWNRMPAQWTPGETANGQQPQDHLSVRDILEFCTCANAYFQQQGQPITWAIPTVTQWRFAVAAQAETLGFKDLQGQVDQCFQQGTGDEYVLCGGSYPDATRLPAWETPEPSLGFRPLLLLGRSDPRHAR